MNTRILCTTLSLCLLTSIPLFVRADCCCDNDYAYGKTHFSQRPQGNYYFVTMMGLADKTHLTLPEHTDNYFLTDLTIGYRQNFDRCYLGRYFFTQNGPLVVGPLNTTVDVANLELGLASNYKGTALLDPLISDVIADFSLYCGLDKWHHGLWFRINVPVVHSTWKPGLSSETAEVGAPYYPDGFAAPTSSHNVPVAYRDLTNALCGDESFGQIPALSAGKICNCNTSLTGVSDIHMELGEDFLRRATGNMGVALIGAIGTGQPDGSKSNRCLIAPSIGSQHSSQLGLAFRGQVDLFHEETGKRTTFYADIRAEHLFAACNKRLMSLDVGHSTAFNYWLLLNEYNSAGTLVGVDRAANLLNKQVKVSANMAELTGMIQGAKNNWQAAVGYNFWYRTQEKLSMCDASIGNGNYYDIASVFESGWGEYLMPKATSNVALQPIGTALDRTLDTIKTQALYSGAIDTCVAAHPATYSNTVFGFIGYNPHCKRLDPYLSLGASVEFGRGNLALSTWGVYLKGGITL